MIFVIFLSTFSRYEFIRLENDLDCKKNKIELNNKSFQECKKKCLENKRCNFIEYRENNSCDLFENCDFKIDYDFVFLRKRKYDTSNEFENKNNISTTSGTYPNNKDLDVLPLLIILGLVLLYMLIAIFIKLGILFHRHEYQDFEYDEIEI